MSDNRHTIEETTSARRILVAEDDYFLAQDMARAVSDTGAHVIGPVPTVERAVNSIDLGRIDGAVIDVRLRDGPAYLVADLLVNLGVPFVFATGYAQMIPSRFSSVVVFEKPSSSDSIAKAVADLARMHDKLQYGVQRNGDIWEWNVSRGSSVVARGSAATSISARIQALTVALHLKAQ